MADITNAKILLNVTTQSTDIAGDELQVEFLNRARFTVVWVNGSSINATIKIQYSDDGATWYDLPFDPEPTITTASGNHYISVTDIAYKFIRPYITFTAGSVDLLVVGQASNS